MFKAPHEFKWLQSFKVYENIYSTLQAHLNNTFGPKCSLWTWFTLRWQVPKPLLPSIESIMQVILGIFRFMNYCNKTNIVLLLIQKNKTELFTDLRHKHHMVETALNEQQLPVWHPNMLCYNSWTWLNISNMNNVHPQMLVNEYPGVVSCLGGYL